MEFLDQCKRHLTLTQVHTSLMTNSVAEQFSSYCHGLGNKYHLLVIVV